MGERGRWPRILVVTDRHRLVRSVGASAAEWPALLQAQIAGALAGGADLVHVREPDLAAGQLAGFLRRLFEQVAGSAARTVVNDRSDIAWVTGAAGVHLTERSVSVEDARALQPAGRRWLIGRSVHGLTGAIDARAATYLVAGTVQPSASKSADRPLLGWPGLAAIVQAVAPTPVVAIGGLGAADVGLVRAAGAAGIAGIGCFLPEASEAVEFGVRTRVLALRKAFDSTEGEPYTQGAGD